MQDKNAVAHPQPLNLGAQAQHFARKLVTGDDGPLDEGEAAPALDDVPKTHPCGPDSDQDPTGTEGGIGSELES